MLVMSGPLLLFNGPLVYLGLSAYCNYSIATQD